MEEKKKSFIDNLSRFDEKEVIKKEDRSPLVRDHDYGRIESINANSRDIPVYAQIEYNSNGNLIFEDYTKLNEVLDEVIKKNIKDTHIKNPITNQSQIAKTIQGNVLTKLKLSEKEMEHAILYLSEKNILVRGVDSSLDSEFDGYQYIRTYKSEPLPPGLTNEQNIELFKKLSFLKREIEKNKDNFQKTILQKEYHDTRHKLIEGNMRLVSYIMYKRIPSYFNEMDKEDIKQIGYEVLIEFIDKYDVNKGYALSTGLYNYFMFHVWREYRKTDMIQKPVYIQEKLNKIIKVRDALMTELGHEPTLEELSEELYIPLSKVKEYMLIYESQNMQSFTDLYSEQDEQLYDHQLDDEAESNFILDSFTSSEGIPESDVSDKEIIKKVLETLSPKEEMILKLRFGLEDGQLRTLGELEKELGITRERIRQIEAKALRKLRHPSRSKILGEIYFDKSQDRYENNGSHKR